MKVINRTLITLSLLMYIVVFFAHGSKIAEGGEASKDIIGKMQTENIFFSEPAITEAELDLSITQLNGEIIMNSSLFNCKQKVPSYETKSISTSNIIPTDKYAVIMNNEKRNYVYDYTELGKVVDFSTIDHLSEEFECDRDFKIDGCRLEITEGVFLNLCDQNYDINITKDDKKNIYYSTVKSISDDYTLRDPSVDIVNVSNGFYNLTDFDGSVVHLQMNETFFFGFNFEQGYDDWSVYEIDTTLTGTIPNYPTTKWGSYGANLTGVPGAVYVTASTPAFNDTDQKFSILARWYYFDNGMNRWGVISGNPRGLNYYYEDDQGYQLTSWGNTTAFIGEESDFMPGTPTANTEWGGGITYSEGSSPEIQYYWGAIGSASYVDGTDTTTGSLLKWSSNNYLGYQYGTTEVLPSYFDAIIVYDGVFTQSQVKEQMERRYMGYFKPAGTFITANQSLDSAYDTITVDADIYLANHTNISVMINYTDTPEFEQRGYFTNGTSSVVFTIPVTVEDFNLKYIFELNGNGETPVLLSSNWTATAGVDAVPPDFTLNPYNTSTTTTSAIINWLASEATNYSMIYSVNADYSAGTTVTNKTLATSHNKTITGLTNSTLYHVNVTIWDAAGNLNWSKMNFTSQANAPIFPSPLMFYWTNASSNDLIVAYVDDNGMFNGTRSYISGAGYFGSNLGIGTETPTKELQVIGDADISKNLTANNIYGEMWYHNHTASEFNFAVDGEYYNLSFSYATINGFTFNNLNDSLTAQVDGLYKACYMASGDGQNNHIYWTGININGAIDESSESHKKMAAGGDIITMNGCGFINIDVGDEIKLASADVGDTGTGNYYSGNLNLVRIGDKNGGTS